MPDLYPYDPGAFARVWQRLWELVPAYYRVLDGGDRLEPAVAARALVEGTLVGQHDLARLLGALAAPLAAVRQSVEELHRDLFIDSAGDGAIPLLAEMVGTTLVFPDAASNRRDVRGTVAWRRRKGTPSMLEDLVDELSGRMTPLLEGWKLLAITQDPNLHRMQRTTIDLRDIRVAERTRGPLDATAHVVDIRIPSETTGRYHPQHLAHFLHMTALFPVRHGEARYIGDQGDPIAGTVNPAATPRLDLEWRYAVHPLGIHQALRARRVGERDNLRSDRIPAMHFAYAPADYFAREGRFTIEILGLPAGVGTKPGELADPLRSLAAPAILAGTHTFELLDRPRRHDNATTISLMAVALAGPPWIASGAQTEIAHVTVDGSTLVNAANVNVAPASTIAMIRLTPQSGTAAFFAGATLLLTAGEASRWRSPVSGSTIDAGELQRRGQLDGAIAFELPPTWITGERWFYLGADGTLGEAQVDGVGPIVVALDPDRRIELSEIVRGGLGSAWPALAYTAERDETRALLPAPGTGPVRMHGGPVLDPGPSPQTAARLVFAIATTETTTTFEPIGALVVGAPVVADRGAWLILDATGAPAAVPLARLQQLAAIVANAREGTQRLVVRFECASANAVLPACEVAWPAATGEGLLVHVPERVAVAPPGAEWPATAGWSVSPFVAVGSDGSTWNGDVLARYACGGIAPLGPADSGHVFHRRRIVRWRHLCPWVNEDKPLEQRLEPTPDGFVDVDVEHGLFAFALAEPPPVAPGERVPNVTVSYEQGFTAHLGALPVERATLLRARPEVATRIVSRSGVAGSGPLTGTLATPRYTTLTAALAAIEADPARSSTEVIEIADSATYANEAPEWPGVTGGGTPTLALIIRAAEGARPIVELAGWSSSATAGFERIVLRGITLASANPVTLAPPLVLPTLDPPLDLPTFELVLSTIASPQITIAITGPESGGRLWIRHAITGPVALIGAGKIEAVESIIDPIIDPDAPIMPVAITALDGTAYVDRCTVLGGTEVNILEGSESIFRKVVVADRFRGCIRFSRCDEDSELPARHRIAHVEPRFTSPDRLDPAYARLAERCDPSIQFGAADGSEMGAFHDELWSVRREAVARRLTEYTPAGLIPGLIRMD